MEIQKINVQTDKNSIKKNPFAVKNAVSTQKSDVSFGSLGSWAGDSVVKLMDKMDAGGFILAFMVGDGIGFIAPRVGKALFRNRPEKKDENGNTIYDKNGNPELGYNWAFAGKEAKREIITGPSAYVIPLAMITGIKKKFGAANNIKVEAIQAISDLTKSDVITPGSSEINKTEFDKAIYKNLVGDKYADKFADLQAEYRKQSTTAATVSDKESKKAAKQAAKNALNEITQLYIKHQKETNPNANLLSTSIKVGDKTFSLGSIGNLPHLIEDYYDDITNVLKKNEGKSIAEVLSEFKGRKSGSRILTILSIFAAVTAFYTQIPKLYNAGLTENPAVASSSSHSEKAHDKTKKEDVSFAGGVKPGFLERLGNKYPDNKFVKGVTDFFELEGATITAKPMSALLFGPCLVPRLIDSFDFNDMMENLTRDALAFTALLFGAKALSRVFNDVLVKQTGLALNEKHNQNDGAFKRAFEYLSPTDSKYHILSNDELAGKYSAISDYKGGIAGFADFINSNGGNLKKALSHDENIKNKVFELFKASGGEAVDKAKTYEELPEQLFKDAKANFEKMAQNADLKQKLEDIEKLFTADNKILRKAKICNSSFGFLSTFVMIPSFIIWLTGYCERMTEKRIAKQKEAQQSQQYVDTVQFNHNVDNPNLKDFMRA